MKFSLLHLPRSTKCGSQKIKAGIAVRGAISTGNQM